MGAVVAAPAHVEPDLLARDIAQGMVERVEAHLGEAPVGRHVHLRVQLPGVGQVGIVDLQQEPSVGDRLLLVVHGIGDGVDERLVVGVVVVDQPMLNGARGDGGQEGLDVGNAFEGGPKVR